ncbi:MAG: CinA family nicotinamide mononucleotide deamidase-related protein [Desulfocapsaceae bacterium]|jgi:nicotinamide-nucleotide amidase|nr:CinA family nicotinamide mononucleotide deamidase-related protein [Desulfocapsaceae bacterium]
MKGEIIAIGDELTSGRILNTTSGFAARKLFDAGYTIHAMSTIGDTPELIGEALLRAIGRVDFIIVTGGLGSTDDDLTNEAVSQALNRPTIPNLEMLFRIRSRLNRENAAPDNQLEKLAWLPSGAEAFNPQSRTAGYQLIHENTPIYFLPGVPDEMQHLMSDAVLPRLAAWKAGSRLRTCQRIYIIFGIPETEVNRIIKTLDIPVEVSVGYYPVFPDVHLSILVRGRNKAASTKAFNHSCHLIEKALGTAIYGTDRDNMETVVGTLLGAHKLYLSVAESCSGGLISHRITGVAGSSAYFAGGAVTYSNELKQHFLGVSKSLLEKYGAVSPDVARAMAIGIREKTGTDIGLSVTGIAGPGGGTAEKPVGTVFIGISNSDSCTVKEYHFAGTRHRIQALTAHTALNNLRLYLLDKKRSVK